MKMTNALFGRMVELFAQAGTTGDWPQDARFILVAIREPFTPSMTLDLAALDVDTPAINWPPAFNDDNALRSFRDQQTGFWHVSFGPPHNYAVEEEAHDWVYVLDTDDVPYEPIYGAAVVQEGFETVNIGSFLFDPVFDTLDAGTGMIIPVPTFTFDQSYQN